MKKVVSLILSAVCMLAFSACGNVSEPADTNQSVSNETASASATPEPVKNDKEEGGKMLVAYFSATGTTRTVAEYAAEILDADIYEIVPEIPYTSADLNYGDSYSRTTQEQNDLSARPAISSGVEDMAQYDVVFLGYPKLEYGFLCV